MSRNNILQWLQHLWQHSLAARYSVWFGVVVGFGSGLKELFDFEPCPVRTAFALLLGIGGLSLVVWFFQEGKETRRVWNLLLLLGCWVPTTLYFSYLATETCKNECPAVDLHAAPKTLLPGEVANMLVTASDPENDEVTFEWEATAPGLFRAGPSYTTTQNEYTAPLFTPPQRVEITVWADDHHCGRKVPAVVFLSIQTIISTPTTTPTFTLSPTPTASSTPPATSTASLTPTLMESVTPTFTPSSTPTLTPTPSSTPSITPSFTPSPDAGGLPPPPDDVPPTPVETAPTRTPPPG